MRFLVVSIIIVIVAASAYYDLSEGTIPYKKDEDAPVNNESNEDKSSINEETNHEDIPYIELKVEAGQTVYGIVQNINEGSFIQAPHHVVEDFEALNPQVSAHEIIIGHTYRFPLYTIND